MKTTTCARALFGAAWFTVMLVVLAFGWAAAAVAVDPGSPLWTRAYGGAGSQQFQRIVGAPGGDVVVAGITDADVQHVVLARYSSSGARRWLKVIDQSRTTDDWSPKIAVDALGNTVLLYTQTVVPSVQTRIVVHKYNARGRRLWKRTLDGGVGGFNSGSEVAVRGTSDVYISGNITAAGPVEGTLIARLRSRDGRVTMRSWQSGVGELARTTGIAVDGKGYIYATGYGDRGDGLDQTVTVKVNPSGQVLWTHAFPGADDYRTVGAHVVLGAGGRLYVAARQTRVGPATTLIVLRYSTGGALQWSDAWDVPGGDMDGVYAAATDRFGNLFLAGAAVTSGPSPSHAFVARWTPTRARWTYVKPDDDEDGTDFRGVVVDQAGGCWTAGTYSINQYTEGGTSCLYVARVSRSGSLRWEQLQVRPHFRLGADAITASSGGLAIAGRAWDGAAYDALVTQVRR